MFKSVLILLLSVFILASCVKDKPIVVNNGNVTFSNAKKVIVVNEGGYTYNQAEVSIYDPETKQVVQEYYKQQNNNQLLGDVLQSINYFNSNYYCVVNNSSKIVVCNNKFQKVSQINGLSSPRYFLPITNSKAYVSDLMANQIHVIDLTQNTKTASISCPGWTEQMVLIYNKAFVCNVKRNFVYVINTIANQITDSVNVGVNAYGLVIDKNDKVWVLSAGDKQNNIPAKLTRINPVNLQIELAFGFGANQSPGNLCINKTKDTLYYLNAGIYQLPIQNTILPNSALINPGTKNFYGLGINPSTYQIYVADALDYIQKSNIYIYTTGGVEQNNFKASYISNGFYFEN